MKERRNKYFFQRSFFLIMIALFLFGCGTQDEVTVETGEEYTKELFAMGTYITMTAYGESAEGSLELSEKRIKELDALWSATEENSDISKMNQSNGEPTKVSRETSEVLRFALDMAEKTDSIELNNRVITSGYKLMNRLRLL